MLTRQLFQPSVNFFEPISTLTVESAIVESGKQRPGELLFRHTTNSACSSHSLHRAGASPTLMTSEGFVLAQPQGNLAVRSLQVLHVQRRLAPAS